METLLLSTADGVLLQVPLTYRGAPVPGGDEHLLGTSEHGVLGTRWIYDGCADPVFAGALATTILTGRAQAQLQLVTPDGPEDPSPNVQAPNVQAPNVQAPNVQAPNVQAPNVRAPNVQVKGSGHPDVVVPPIESVEYSNGRGGAVIRTAGLRMELLRVAGERSEPPRAAFALFGTWDGQGPPALLAIAELI
jgi:hypothetical protein